MENEKTAFSTEKTIRNPKTETTATGAFQAFAALVTEGDPMQVFDSCLVDLPGRQFSCVHGFCDEHPSCLKNDFLTEKIDFHGLTFHPDDRRTWCEMAFPDILRFVHSEYNEANAEYRFIFNHRYIRKDGSISQFIHEGALSIGEDLREPTLNLLAFSEIADIKPDETMILTIFRYHPEQGYRKVFTKVYAGRLESCLTARELEIVRLCHEGLSSKMIAGRLNLSVHTVKNHKRNCMAKTNTHNISELIHYCIRNRWL